MKNCKELFKHEQAWMEETLELEKMPTWETNQIQSKMWFQEY